MPTLQFSGCWLLGWNLPSTNANRGTGKNWNYKKTQKESVKVDLFFSFFRTHLVVNYLIFSRFLVLCQWVVAFKRIWWIKKYLWYLTIDNPYNKYKNLKCSKVIGKIQNWKVSWRSLFFFEKKIYQMEILCGAFRYGKARLGYFGRMFYFVFLSFLKNGNVP